MMEFWRRRTRPTAHRVLFQAGDERSAHEEQIKRDILLEKWKGTMQLIAGGTSNENTRKRAIIGESVSGTRSQTEFERKPLEEIQRCVNVLMALEKRLAI
jgi:hypothetical protein